MAGVALISAQVELPMWAFAAMACLGSGLDLAHGIGRSTELATRLNVAEYLRVAGQSSMLLAGCLVLGPLLGAWGEVLGAPATLWFLFNAVSYAISAALIPVDWAPVVSGSTVVRPSRSLSAGSPFRLKALLGAAFLCGGLGICVPLIGGRVFGLKYGAFIAQLAYAVGLGVGGFVSERIALWLRKRLYEVAACAAIGLYAAFAVAGIFGSGLFLIGACGVAGMAVGWPELAAAYEIHTAGGATSEGFALAARLSKLAMIASILVGTAVGTYFS